MKDDDFLLLTPTSYNALGLATTQLYNRTLVYNRKRHGQFTFGNRTYDFRVKPRFPKKLTPEFLFVDLLNNLDEMPEERELILRNAPTKSQLFDKQKLVLAASKYGNVKTKKQIRGWLNV